MDEGQMLCFTCPVRVECDNYRERTNSSGMWAGQIKKR